MIGFVEEFLRGLTLREGLTTAADILVVYYVIYRSLRLVKGTRAAQMLIGIALVGAAFYGAKFLELTTLSWLLDNLINYSIIFLIVIFQNDIRRALARVGQNLFGAGRQYEETYVFEEVIRAAEQLARSRLGGLFVLERDADLEEFYGEPGELIDGRVSKELLVALFLPDPQNTVHDGAVVIKNLRVQRAGCVLPLSANPKLDKAFGTRHRAAIGITEETDAVVVVVSEERGTISLCFGGNIARDLDSPTLRKALLGLFRKPTAEAAQRRERSGPPQKSARAQAGESMSDRITTRFRIVPDEADRVLFGKLTVLPSDPAAPTVTAPQTTLAAAGPAPQPEPAPSPSQSQPGEAVPQRLAEERSVKAPS